MSRELFEAIRSWTATVENIFDPTTEYNPRLQKLMEQLARFGCDIRQRTPEAKAHGLAGVEQPAASETVGVKAVGSSAVFCRLLETANRLVEDDRFDYLPTTNCPPGSEEEGVKIWNDLVVAIEAAEEEQRQNDRA